MFTYHFIDSYETQNAVGEYYDFRRTTADQWQALDKLEQTTCTARGIPPNNLTAEQNDIYCAILD
ncbi:MAG: hypothetical protein IJ756_07005 [Paludibacteraceae bacterium]|nr:hypothetical protein [Paludibacteraceae bacterium]